MVEKISSKSFLLMLSSPCSRNKIICDNMAARPSSLAFNGKPDTRSTELSMSVAIYSSNASFFGADITVFSFLSW